MPSRPDAPGGGGAHEEDVVVTLRGAQAYQAVMEVGWGQEEGVVGREKSEWGRRGRGKGRVGKGPEGRYGYGPVGWCWRGWQPWH